MITTNLVLYLCKYNYLFQYFLQNICCLKKNKDNEDTCNLEIKMYCCFHSKGHPDACKKFRKPAG